MINKPPSNHLSEDAEMLNYSCSRNSRIPEWSVDVAISLPDNRPCFGSSLQSAKDIITELFRPPNNGNGFERKNVNLRKNFTGP
jgi:hypothetical protein